MAEVKVKEGTTQIVLFNKYKAAVVKVLKKLAAYNKKSDKVEAKADY